MNKIIFDDFLEKEKESDYYPKHLKMPPKEKEKPDNIITFEMKNNSSCVRVIAFEQK